MATTSTPSTGDRKPVLGERINDEVFVNLCAEQFKATPMGRKVGPDSPASRDLLETFAWGIYSGLKLAGKDVTAIHPNNLITRVNAAVEKAA
jgi:hypothetical protein